MITFKKFGKTIKIANSDWRKIRKRFNPHNALIRGGKYIIKITCPLCKKYRVGRCDGCPFDVFCVLTWLDTAGCTEFFSQIFSSKFKGEMDNTQHVCWQKKDDLEVRKYLYKLQEIMDKIEASQ